MAPATWKPKTAETAPEPNLESRADIYHAARTKSALKPNWHPEGAAELTEDEKAAGDMLALTVEHIYDQGQGQISIEKILETLAKQSERRLAEIIESTLAHKIGLNEEEEDPLPTIWADEAEQWAEHLQILGVHHPDDPEAPQNRGRAKAQKMAADRQQEHDAGAVEEIRTMRAAGTPWRDIAASLNDAGLRAPMGGAWHESAVRRIARRHKIR